MHYLNRKEPNSVSRYPSLSMGLVGLALLLGAPLAAGKIIFSENFDNQPDWTSTMHTTKSTQRARSGDILPVGWDSIYNGTVWSPETGYPENHASLEILEANADKARGGKGKSAVMWRESYSRGWNNWASDSQLIKFLDQGEDEIYAEFYIRFSPNFYGINNRSGYVSKLFRIGSWSGSGDEFNGAAGDLGPIVFWDYRHDSYGIRNVLAYRGGPHGENYNFNREYVTDESRNFNSDLIGQEEGGADSNLRSTVSGVKLTSVKSGVLSHEDVFGPAGTWTKVGFYVKMNSSPGKKDGIFRQWINGHRVVNRTDIPWVMANADNKMVKWNYIAIGGNDFFQAYDNSVRFEDWYAIDDLVVHNSMPDDAGSSDSADLAPSPPTNITVE